MFSIEYLKLLSLLKAGMLVHSSPTSNVSQHTPSNIAPSPNATTVTYNDWLAPNLGWLSPEYKWFFEYPLPIPSVKKPKLLVNCTLRYPPLPTLAQYLCR
jgi:hypothetical protein